MASLPTRTTASFAALAPVPSLDPLDDEFDALVGAAGFLNGNSSGTKLLVRTSDANDPPIECDQLGAGTLAEWKQNGTLKASIDNSGDFSASGITGAAGVYTFDNIPVGPASTPTTDNQLTRKKYVDDKIVPFNLGWKIDDPSTFALSSASVLQQYRIPAVTGGFIHKLVIIFMTGSHTPGASVTFRVQIGFAGQASTAVSFNDTNSSLQTPYGTDFTDIAISEGDFISVEISARSGTVSERNVSINLEGYRKVQ